ncbi:general transcription factor IIH subunit 3 [Daphnia magna]|uniref:General transcription factor IIH subunit 3 n=2 Tax=Daphnia magna TaxID=35525 RepID=A0A0P5G1I2_9CRUS|nr:general transcription factor IIH subunit 3 [Daphnia magna]XP_032792020.1 general transcription factor IIH subunit 3 [Daphnia magna]KAK4035955.1 hypothetical protein OUZ56_028033 [Daphnia magna]
MEDKEERIETSLVAIVIDATPAKKFASQPLDGSSMMNRIFDSLIAFGNAHLMQASHNKLAIIACNSKSTKFLYPSMDGTSRSYHNRPGQYDMFAKVDSDVRHGLGELILNDMTDNDSTKSDSLLGGAMARALSYIHRVQRELSLSHQLKPRVLVVSGSCDSALQYMTFMNVFFTAQKENVVIDCCMMDTDSGLLQQGCDITGGQYLHIPSVAGLLEYLLWVFLPSPSCRSKIVLPPPTKVDYRAACFCHHKLVDIGWVCSVCLSIFCKFSIMCTTCNTEFKLNRPAIVPAKSKKRARIE